MRHTVPCESLTEHLRLETATPDLPWHIATFVDRVIDEAEQLAERARHDVEEDLRDWTVGELSEAFGR